MHHLKSTPDVLPTQPAQPTDAARRAEIAATVHLQFDSPRDPLRFTAEDSGRYAMQVRLLRDALVRYGQHASYCTVTEATWETLDGVRCTCGLDDAIRDGSR